MSSEKLTATSLWFPAPRTVELRTEQIGKPDAGEVRIQTIASGISAGTELLVYRGLVPPELPLDLPGMAGSFGFPIKFGYASVGRIVETGAGVDASRMGELVFVHHPHQSQYVARSEDAITLGDETPPTVGTLLANLETAINVVLDAHPRLGDRIVIFGQGVVGLLITALLRRAGAGLLIAVEPDAARANLSMQLGADGVARDGDEAAQMVENLGHCKGADIALECSGNPAAMDEALGTVAAEGSLVAVSWYGVKPVPLHLGAEFHRKRLRIISSQVGGMDPALTPRWNRGRRLDLARAILPQIPVHLLVTHQIPFQRAREAYQLLESRKDGAIHIALTYEDRNV